MSTTQSGAVDFGAARHTLDFLADSYERARSHLAGLVQTNGKAEEEKITRHQAGAHALGHLAVQVEAGRQLLGWVERLNADPSSLEARICASWIARSVAGLPAGITLGGIETVALADIGLSSSEAQAAIASNGTIAGFLEVNAGASADDSIAALLLDLGHGGSVGLDEGLTQVRSQFTRFVADQVAPIAMRIHSQNELVPLDLIHSMAELGVFGLTTPEVWSGSGLGKLAMVIVTEELCRGSIGVGSLGTRSEIAIELILSNGTEEQKKKWIPPLARAEILPTAAFTEPNFGSDLASVQTRAVKVEGGWRITGNKTWMTHGGRSDVMTLLARTDPSIPGHRGLSMFIAPKQRGTEEQPFPDAAIHATEIHVLGYHGMREYEVAFDDFFVPDDALLGGVTGQGLRQLLATFETARIQTAARGTGLAQAAFDEGFRYARERVQFGQPLASYPRIRNKLARSAVAIQAARQLTYHAARKKESGVRCDLEAGMAKMLATRSAWEVADASLQIHGGVGYATATPISRILLDSRVLSIFEGTNEIQAQIIARRLLGE